MVLQLRMLTAVLGLINNIYVCLAFGFEEYSWVSLGFCISFWELTERREERC